MKAFARLILLLVISTLITGYRLPEVNDPGSAMYDPGSAMYDADYPVDQEFDNDLEGANLVDLDFPFDEENDYGSG